MELSQQIKWIKQGGAEIIQPEELEAKLKAAGKEGRPLTVKLGLDPTAPDIHLGHTVVLRKIRQLQELGHRAVIIIGDFTGMIGDPTGKSKARKQLSRVEVLQNARTYEEQIFKVLDREKTEVRFNSEWLSKLGLKEALELASRYTVARMLEREDFKNRFQGGESIGIHEFFYPLMQAFDSVEIKADIELGGTDQRFNILMGRTLQKDYGQESQAAIFMPILEGTDGREKMSKSLGNYIGIHEAPEEMYGKTMSIPDELIVRYFALTTDIHPDELESLERQMAEGKLNPRDAKMQLARELVRLYHGEEAAQKAEGHFRTVFQQKGAPEEMPEVTIASGLLDLPALMVEQGLAASKSEARRLVEQGAVRLDGEKVKDAGTVQICDGQVLQVGKKGFVRLRVE